MPSVDDWSGRGAFTPVPPATDEVGTDGIVRREPVLDTHEEVTPARDLVNEFDALPLPDRTEERAAQLQLLFPQMGALARQAVMDPADGLGL